MFADQFINAAGFDYRGFNNTPSQPYDESFIQTPEDNAYTTETTQVFILNLQRKIEQQNEEIRQSKTIIQGLQRQLVEKIEEITYYEEEVANWKKRVADNDEMALNFEKMSRIVEDQRQNELNDDSFQDQRNVYITPMKSSINKDSNRNKESESAHIFTNTENKPSTLKSKLNQIQSSPSIDINRFKTLVKLLAQTMTINLKIMTKVNNKSISETLNILKQNLRTFVDNFNKKYQQLKKVGFSDHQEMKITRVLKEFGNELGYLYDNMFNKTTSSKKKDIATTAKK